MNIRELILEEKWDSLNEALENGNINIDDCVNAVIEIGNADTFQVFISEVKNISGHNILKLASKEIELREEPLRSKLVNYAKLENAPLEDLSNLAMFDGIKKPEDNAASIRSALDIIEEIGASLTLINFIICSNRPWGILSAARSGKNITKEMMERLAEGIVLTKNLESIGDFIIKIPNAPLEIIFNQILKSKLSNEEIIKILEKMAKGEGGILKKLSSSSVDALVEYFISSHDDKKIWELAILIQDVADSTVERNFVINKLIKALNSDIIYFGQNVRESGSIENLGDRLYNSGNKEGIVHFVIDFNPSDERFSPFNINNTFFSKEEREDVSNIIMYDYILEFGRSRSNKKYEQIGRCSNFIVGTGSKKQVYKYIKYSWESLDSASHSQIINYIISTKNPYYLYLCSRVMLIINNQQALEYAQAMVDLHDPVCMVCLLFNSDILLCGVNTHQFPARELLARTIQNDYDMVEVSNYLMSDPYKKLEEYLLKRGDEFFEKVFGNNYYARLTGRDHEDKTRN